MRARPDHSAHRRVAGARRTWLVAAALLSVVACGSSSSTGTGSGSLTVEISGLPGGTSASVVVTGPAFRQDLTQTTTLSSLVPGNYTVAASSITMGDSTFAPTPPTQNVAVGGDNSTASASVSYQALPTIAITLTPVLTMLQDAVFLGAPHGDSRLFVVEQRGVIRVAHGNTLLPTPFLDISGKVLTGVERGLLSVAFHPDYANNGRFYVYYTDGDGDIAIEGYHVSSGNPDVADTASTRLLTIPHRQFANHNGGLVAFGPDGELYIGTGDGGGADNQLQTAQNTGSLLGKLLRIDVDHGSPYTIPSDNPFVGQSGKQGEIWAYGLRNPWRFAFDPSAALLYIADVGQDAYEEVDVSSTTAAGVNYGWSIMEGMHCFNGGSCNQTGLALPVFEYPHPMGCAITGGYVYRGSRIPSLIGRYLFSDYCTGFLAGFYLVGGKVTETRYFDVGPLSQVTSFGEDGSGEVYVVTASTIYRIDPT